MVLYRYRVYVSHRFVCSLGTEHPKDLAADLVKPYKINETTVNQALELNHGESIRVFNIELAISITQRVCLKSFTERIWLLQEHASRWRGQGSLTLAQRRMDFVEVAEISKKLEEPNANTELSSAHAVASEEEDKLAKVNERNRKAKPEAVIWAERVAAERKRKLPAHDPSASPRRRCLGCSRRLRRWGRCPGCLFLAGRLCWVRRRRTCWGRCPRYLRLHCLVRRRLEERRRLST